VNPKAKTAGLIGIGLLIAGVGVWLFERHFSPAAQIEAMHRACLKEFADAAEKMKAGAKPDEDSSSIVRGLSESLGKWIEGLSGSMGDTVCAAVRDACNDDFDGRICTFARERYR
jgi:hypothetical protein